MLNQFSPPNSAGIYWQGPLVGIDYLANAAGYAERHPGWIIAWLGDLVRLGQIPGPVSGAPVSRESQWRAHDLQHRLAKGFPPVAALIHSSAGNTAAPDPTPSGSGAAA